VLGKNAPWLPLTVELRKAPSVSAAGLALAHGINANLLRRWIVRYGGETVPEAHRGGGQRGLRLVKIVEPNPPAPVTTGGSIELTFKSATIGSWAWPFAMWLCRRTTAAKRQSGLLRRSRLGAQLAISELATVIGVLTSFDICG
jgi:hypothetical protein